MDLSSAILSEARGHLATFSHAPAPGSAEAAGMWRWLEQHPEALHHPYVQEHLERLGLESTRERLTHHLGCAFAHGVPCPKVTACEMEKALALHFPLETDGLRLSTSLCWHTAAPYRSLRRGSTAGQCSVRVEVRRATHTSTGHLHFDRGPRAYLWHEVNDWCRSTPGKDLIFNFWGRDVVGIASIHPWKTSGNPPSYVARTHWPHGAVWRLGEPESGLRAVVGRLIRVGKAAVAWDRDLQARKEV